MNLIKPGIILLSAFFSCGMSFCSLTPKGHRIYTVGDSVEWKHNDELIATITLKNAIYSKNDDGDDCQIYITYTIAPTQEVQLEYEKMNLDYDDSRNIKSYTDIERATERNGYNIFETTISEDTDYTFCFNIPYDRYFKRYEDDPEETVTSTITGCTPASELFYLYTYKIYKASMKEE